MKIRNICIIYQPGRKFKIKLSRRDFLSLSSISLGTLAYQSVFRKQYLNGLPVTDALGRVAISQTELKLRSRDDSQTIRIVYEDEIFPVMKEVVGVKEGRINQKWSDTGEGYLWSAHVQPVRNIPNSAVGSFTEINDAGGMWVEVTVPYVDLVLDNPPSRAPIFQDRTQLGSALRLYYSQVTWVDQLKIESGQTWYRVNEKFGGYGDILWGKAEAFRPMKADEISPIHPEAENKSILVNTSYQTLSCFENEREVYYARISSGAFFDAWGNKVDAWATPLGEFPIWRKLLSLHMSGGSTGGGWDLPAVGWVSLFVGSGVAIHSTFWHNNFGEPSSKGCVNASPGDAKWIFRWTLPNVAYNPGDMSVSMPGGTRVKVVES
jgi:hypothetical protein